MPTYDYRCKQCSTAFEATHRIATSPPPCPQCGGSVQQVFLAAPAVHGYMARGREMAARTLERKPPVKRHGPGCPCCA